jgi:hypothetical protein
MTTFPAKLVSALGRAIVVVMLAAGLWTPFR